jgi:hypothetical protein
MSCSLRVFSNACNSASITSVTSKWRPFSFIFYRGNTNVGWVGETVMLFLVKNFLVKKEVWDCALSWRNSQFFCHQSLGRILCTSSCSSVKRHSNMGNWLFGLPWRILCEQSPWCQRRW